MDTIFQILSNSITANQYALDAVGRYNAPVLGVVTNNSDPDGKRRVKISDPACPALETNWLRAIRPYPQLDPPIPSIGSTVMVWFVDGDPSKGFYLPIQNDTNPPADKQDEVKDFHENIPGDRESETGGDRLENVAKTYTVRVGTSFRLENTAGAYIELTAAGLVEIADAYGHKIRIGSGSLNDLLEWDLGGGKVRIKNAADFQISTGDSGFETIATVSAPDTDGDLLTSSGWT